MSDDDTLGHIRGQVGDVSAQWRAHLAPHLSAGRRVPELRRGLTLAVETIYEGWALHAAAPRTLVSDAPGSLRLLVGDWCYAAGLCAVAEAGDLDAVASLADLIADVAVLAAEQPRGAGSPDPRELRWDQALSSLR